MAPKDTIDAVISWVMRLKPVRVYFLYAEKRGPLLAAGLSFQAIFAVFAAIWVLFAVAGVTIASNPELQRALFDLLATNVPGLIDDGSGNGAIDPEQLLGTSTLTWTGAIAAIGLLFTALGWLASGRDAVRSLFDLPGSSTNFLLLQLKDLGLAIGFGLVMILSAGLSVLSTTALGSVFSSVGIESDSDLARYGARAIGLILVLVLDTVVLALFYRVVSGIQIPLRQLAQGTILAAVALGVLKALGSVLLAGATRNPLLASFAVIIGLLIWFNLICQVILLGAAWIKATADDAGIDLRGARLHGKKGSAPPTQVGTAL